MQATAPRPQADTVAELAAPASTAAEATAQRESVLLPAMGAAQAASWHALLDLYERMPVGWTLVGGQLVHLHCAERDYATPRSTNDADMVLDVRANPGILLDVTTTLASLDFEADGISAEGTQHRWVRGDAQIDILLPDGIGERAQARGGVSGSPTISTPGGTQALQRSEAVAVTVEGRQGHVLRPNLVGALIMKAAAHESPGDPAKGRHRADFATLAAMIAARDLRGIELNTKDRKRLRVMIQACRSDAVLLARTNAADAAIERLERAANLAK